MAKKKENRFGRKNRGACRKIKNRKSNAGKILISGTFRGTGRGYAFITPDGGGEDVFVPAFALGGALNGDRVSAEAVTDKRTGRLEAHVLDVLQQTTVYVVGTYTLSKSGKPVIIPDDGKVCKLFLIESYLPGCGKPTEGYKVVGRPTDRDGDILFGELVEVLGQPDVKGVDILSVARVYGLDEEFPPEVQAAARNVAFEVSAKEIAGREDFRGETTVTVDAPDAKDLDDAISVSRKGDGFVLSVHIADVSHYVKENGSIDKEAFRRGTSVYFPGCVFPMLPRELSNGICSLNPAVDRLTLSCIMNVDIRGRITASRIVRGVIRTVKRMDYDTVADIVEGDERARAENADVCEMLDAAKELAEILHLNGIRRGSINFDIPECKLTLDENGVCVNAEKYERRISHTMIEEFMLAANETVAETFDSLETPFVYRSHEKPPCEKEQAFISYLGTLGINFRGGSSAEYAGLLEKIKGTPDERAVSVMGLRTMAKAKYTDKDLGHFGLALKHYCHFTSPIRRYPDLQIHRIITEYIAHNGRGMKKYRKIAAECAAQSSLREQIALTAERRADDLKKAEYMSSRIGETFEGNVCSVTEWGLFIELPNCIEGLIRKERLGGNAEFDEKRRIIACGNKCWRIGDPVKVICEGVENGKIDFRPAR